MQRHAQREHGAVAAGEVVREAGQAGRRGVGELADGGGQPDGGAEGCGREFALDQQARQGDDVADGQAEADAAGVLCPGGVGQDERAGFVLESELA